MKILTSVLAASILMAGCASNGVDTSHMTWEQVVAMKEARDAKYQRDLALSEQGVAQMQQRLNQQIQAQQQQNAQWQAPQAVPYGQPTNTITAYCRDLTNQIVTCRQIK